MLQKNVPLVDQAVGHILAQIESETLARADGLLPSEDELARQLNVSRATVRGALGKLEAIGVINRRHGVGTFLNRALAARPAAVRGWLDEARGYADLIRDSDRQASREIIETVVRAAGEVAGCLELGSDELVVSMERVFLSELVPVIHCINIVPLSLVDPEYVGQACRLYEAAESTYQFIDRYCHVRTHHQRSEIRAVPADETIARRLQVEQGAPLLRVEEVAYSQEAQPVFYGLSHFRGDMVSFEQLRHPSLNIAPHPANGYGK